MYLNQCLYKSKVEKQALSKGRIISLQEYTRTYEMLTEHNISVYTLKYFLNLQHMRECHYVNSVLF